MSRGITGNFRFLSGARPSHIDGGKSEDTRARHCFEPGPRSVRSAWAQSKWDTRNDAPPGVQQHLPLEEYSSHMPCRAFEQLRRTLAAAVPSVCQDLKLNLFEKNKK
jgi:hypothetical protein